MGDAESADLLSTYSASRMVGESENRRPRGLRQGQASYSVCRLQGYNERTLLVAPHALYEIFVQLDQPLVQQMLCLASVVSLLAVTEEPYRLERYQEKVHRARGPRAAVRARGRQVHCRLRALQGAGPRK